MNWLAYLLVGLVGWWVGWEISCGWIIFELISVYLCIVIKEQEIERLMFIVHDQGEKSAGYATEMGLRGGGESTIVRSMRLGRRSLR